MVSKLHIWYKAHKLKKKKPKNVFVDQFNYLMKICPI